MEIREFQRQAESWHGNAKLGSESERQARRVLHSAGEVVGAAAWEFATTGVCRWEDLGKTLADVVIAAMNHASLVGFDMDEQLQERLDHHRAMLAEKAANGKD